MTEVIVYAIWDYENDFGDEVYTLFVDCFYCGRRIEFGVEMPATGDRLAALTKMKDEILLMAEDEGIDIGVMVFPEI